MQDIEGAENSGMDWRIHGATPMSRAIATQRYSRLAATAIAHNDLHLRNILVRGTSAHLIDFESCGAGHPAVDLVRLELALFLTFYFPVVGDEVHVAMQRAISDPNCSHEQFVKTFGVALQPPINSLCMRAVFSVRDQALKAVLVHGGDDKDYVAAKYLVAWQSLLLEDRQVSLARSVIAALAPQFA
jgi:hypothetical protein